MSFYRARTLASMLLIAAGSAILALIFAAYLRPDHLVYWLLVVTVCG